MSTMDLDGRLLMPDLPDHKQATIALVARFVFALQHNAQRFRAILDDVSEPIALLEPNGNQIEMNLTAVKMVDEY
jgi:PAS domain-containing protein